MLGFAETLGLLDTVGTMLGSDDPLGLLGILGFSVGHSSFHHDAESRRALPEYLLARPPLLQSIVGLSDGTSDTLGFAETLGLLDTVGTILG